MRKPPPLIADPAGLIDAIEARVRPTMGAARRSGEAFGLISEGDFNLMVGMLKEACGAVNHVAAQTQVFENAMRLASMPCEGHC